MKGPVTKKQLKNWYGISYKTLHCWLKKIPDLDINKKRIFSSLEAQKIFAHLGEPSIII